MSGLETELIEDIKARKHVSLERALLVVSGLRSEEEIHEYTQKLDRIYHDFVKKLRAKSPVTLSVARKHLSSFVARSLFEYLWNVKPRRCDSQFLLTEVIEAQLNPDINQKVGSCVGLTSLYTILGLREHLHLSIMVSNSHLLNRLRIGENTYNIDNTDPLGFDCDLDEKRFHEYPAIGILAHVLNSRGLYHERMGDLEVAKEDYNKAIKIKPVYANAYNNRGNVRLKQKDYVRAIDDYNEAIQFSIEFAEAYYNRGIAHENLGNYSSAIEDYDRTIDLDPNNVDAYLRRAVAKRNLGDCVGATEDFDKVIELDPAYEARIMRLR